MLIWLFIVFFTLVILLLAFWPAFARGLPTDENAHVEEFEHDVAVYKDQLSELDREITRGAISAEDAKQARVEIAGRLLKSEEKYKRVSDSSTDKKQRIFSGRALTAIALIFVPGISLLMYTSLGSPGFEAQPLKARIEAARNAEMAAQQQSSQRIQQLVDRAEAHLQTNPEDGLGWEVLAPIYRDMGEFDKAINAYNQAIRILGETPKNLAGLGEVHFAMEQGVVTPKALGYFNQAIALDDKNERAVYFLGLAEEQAGRFDGAVGIWKRIVDNPSAEANWRVFAAESISRLARQKNQDTAPEALPGPDQETIAAADEMSSDDRQQMIAGMVSQLDSRLGESGGSIDEWKRLIRARVVLNQQDEAQKAVSRALTAFEGRDTEIEEIKQFAKLIGVGAEATN